MILAKNVVNSPNLVDTYQGKYAMIVDWAIIGVKGPIMDNLAKAVNIFAEKGWRCINIAPTG